MRIAPSPRLIPAGREEKEAKLRDFISLDLAARRESGASTGLVRYTLLARAPDSPVARAISAVMPDLIAADATVDLLLLDLDGFAEEPVRASLLDMHNVDVRLLRDPRFSSAHEQLVLNMRRVWIGDCMRRDPAKRDAFELFHDDNATAATHAAVSFSRMWAAAQPVRRINPVGPEFVIPGQMAGDSAPNIAPRR